ncbi:PH domain-containing protein [Candidatus Gottesmanbacteria bacterium]|nr:PH domain-containing protein [Candidatus Gottesmanbacteria bacterium]
MKQAAPGVSPIKAKVHSVMSPLTCFAVNPSGVRFETQQDDEEVILFLRQHIIVNVPWLILAALLLVAPTVLFPLIFGNLKLPFVIPVSYIIVGMLFWYLATAGFTLMSFLRWFFNIYIVTNERVVDIDFIHLLYKEFSEARLEKVQDLSYKTGGIFAAFFNFGDVAIQTAGELPNFEFDAVPRPERVIATISELVEKVKEGGV